MGLVVNTYEILSGHVVVVLEVFLTAVVVIYIFPTSPDRFTLSTLCTLTGHCLLKHLLDQQFIYPPFYPWVGHMYDFEGSWWLMFLEVLPVD